MKTEKIILFLTLFLLVSAPIGTNAQVISSLNEQNTKIAKQEKPMPKKQTQFSAQGATKVSIDTTTIYYAYLDSAQNCIDEKNWSKAEDFIRKSIKSEPGNPNNSLLISNLATIQVDNAMSDYKKIIAIEPDNEEARYNIGMIYLEKNDFKEAERQFDEILRYHPNSLLSNEGKAFLCKATGNYAKAASHFSEVIKASPSVTLLANRADCYLMTNKLSEAADDINSAIQITPDDGYLYLLRAKLKKMRYENDESKKDIQLAIDHGVDPKLAKEMLK